jgi:Tfp pilus assembly protein PilW
MRRYRQRGSAFVEILIAVMLAALLVLSITAITPTTTRMQTQAQQYTYATNLAQTVLERIRTLDFNQITFTGLQGEGLAQTLVLDEPNHFIASFTTITTPGGGTINLGANLRNGTGTIEVFNLTTNNNIAIGLKTVFVTIRWQEPRTNRWQQVQVATSVASLQ